MNQSRIRVKYNPNCTLAGNPRKGSGEIRGMICVCLIIIKNRNDDINTTIIGAENLSSRELSYVLDNIASRNLRTN